MAEAKKAADQIEYYSRAMKAPRIREAAASRGPERRIVHPRSEARNCKHATRSPAWSTSPGI